jgi:hypothetical protein
MSAFIEVLPIICGGIASLMLRSLLFSQTTYRYAALGVLSLMFGTITNQMAGEPLAFIVVDTLYVALSASIGLVLVKKMSRQLPQ